MIFPAPLPAASPLLATRVLQEGCEWRYKSMLFGKFPVCPGNIEGWGKKKQLHFCFRGRHGSVHFNVKVVMKDSCDAGQALFLRWCRAPLDVHDGGGSDGDSGGGKGQLLLRSAPDSDEAVAGRQAEKAGQLALLEKDYHGIVPRSDSPTCPNGTAVWTCSESLAPLFDRVPSLTGALHFAR